MSPRPVLFVYKEIVAGDLRKLLAQSNDSETGGGARDLRLPAKTFRPMMNRIFTKDATGRGGRQIRVADVTYVDEQHNVHQTEIQYWPPTTSRPLEDRIARIHANPALGGQLPKSDRGRVFVLFIKFSDGTIRCAYAYEDDLRAKGKWSAEVSRAILGCMASAAVRKDQRTVQGYYDFDEGKGFCHAD
ncbi:hypothetical protein IUU84_04380 [Kocuria rhizophila]|uniref:hypothetical protein n=1 Tax=Kocuria rhizophila TaxID=72000 RepID=UPI002948F263|nr:hypothetical protein [Kocuria rhizophila]MDV5998825.1 hypothetical protein [Kocuria rhizophila]